MIYEYWFAGVHPLSGKKKRQLREYYQDARNIYYIEEGELDRIPFLGEGERKALREAKRNRNLDKDFRKAEDSGIRLVPYFDAAYPKRLKEISAPPYALYVKGRLPEEEKPGAAIIGARKCTAYGEHYALEFGRVLAGAGVQIISGMARGIDGAGQRGALEGGGYTCGVLGCGADVCYPREHQGLYRDLEERGGIVSELPPGTPPLPAHFPARNRIISGLSDVILVMEAKERSGSLITADCALEQGKDVYALPGPVSSPLSLGCNRLIRQGAGILLSPEDFLEEIGISPAKCGQKSDKNEKMLESPENMLYSRLGLFPKSVHQLVEETGLGPAKVLALLTSLELKGCIREVSKNYYVRTQA